MKVLSNTFSIWVLYSVYPYFLTPILNAWEEMASHVCITLTFFLQNNQISKRKEIGTKYQQRLWMWYPDFTMLMLFYYELDKCFY